MRYALYARKSTEEDERQAQSLADQKARCLDLARTLGLDETAIVLFEEARSAKEPGRPEFGRMLAALDRGEVGGVIAWHPDRLSRNEMDAAALTMRVRKRMIRDLRFANYHFHNSPEGVMMLQFALSQSQYSSKLALDVKRGINSKVAKGWSPHRALPGYVNDKRLNKGEKTISPDPERFPLVQRTFGAVLSGAHTPRQALALLNGPWGCRSRPTGKGGNSPMGKTVFYRLLADPFYAGFFRHAGELHQGRHAPMIRAGDHERLLEILGKKARLQPKRRAFAFTGLIRCARCRRLVTAQITTNRYGSGYVYYRCPSCRGQVISERRLREQIDAEVDRVSVRHDDFLLWAGETIRDFRGKDEEAEQAALEQKRAALASAQGQMENLLTALTKGLVTEDEYQARKARLQGERNRLTVETVAHDERQARAEETLGNVLRFIANVKGWMENGDTATQRACVGALASNLRLDGKKLLLEPHPLLSRVRAEYKGLEAKYVLIKHGKIRSESAKKRALQPVRSAWSRMWDLNQTTACRGQVSFPRLDFPPPEEAAPPTVA